VLGHDIEHASQEIRRLVGYMPEHDCLPPDVSASDFVVHLAMMSGLPRVAARERAAEVLREALQVLQRARPERERVAGELVQLHAVSCSTVDDGRSAVRVCQICSVRRAAASASGWEPW
jgi:hypothetical protein